MMDTCMNNNLNPNACLIHPHPLVLTFRENWKCNVCGNNFINYPSCWCSMCDFDCCFICAGRILSKSFCMPNNLPNFPSPFGPLIMSNNLKESITTFKKPVIYLYSEKEIDAKVSVKLKQSKFSCVYPKFNGEKNTWKVKVFPNEKLEVNKKKYPYLFWESKSYENFTDMNKGFIVKSDKAKQFLEEKLNILGLNEKETSEFIIYWLPVLLKNKISLCSFQFDSYTQNVDLDIKPKPDCLIRVFLAIKKLPYEIDVEPQELEKVFRKTSGFIAVEWGGTNF